MCWTSPVAGPSRPEWTAALWGLALAYFGFAPLSNWSAVLAAVGVVVAVIALDWFMVARYAGACVQGADGPYKTDETRRTYATWAAWAIALVSFVGVLVWRNLIGESSWLGAPLILMIALAFWMSLSFATTFFSTRQWLWWWVRPLTAIVTAVLLLLFLTGPYN